MSDFRYNGYYEENLWGNGKTQIIGVDEAGRGPLAGPVVAGAVCLNPKQLPSGIKDSKRLSPLKRKTVETDIRKNAHAFGIGIVHEQEIDRINIFKATFKAMRQALEGLDIHPAAVLVDGKFTIPNVLLNQTAIIGGDDKSLSIGAASILAKTYRDRMMISYHVLFPEYGFDRHKGYGSAAHLAALKEFGRCPIHRRSFQPVKDTPNVRFRQQNETHQSGWLGEIFTGMYYVRNGYQLVAHRFHGSRDGEIDLIARKGQELVFVEVKSFFVRHAADAALFRVTPAKQRIVADTAEYFFAHAGLINEPAAEIDSRFDIVTVDFSHRKPVLKQYADAFIPV